MKNYFNMNKIELLNEKNNLYSEYKKLKNLNLNLDISRGKPCREQLDLSLEMLNVIDSKYKLFDKNSCCDARNYGNFEGMPEMRQLFSQILNLPYENIFIGGNSSLSLMFDAVSCFFGKNSKKTKFLCPVPGYDRHFAICEYFDIEMIPVQMTNSGPDMNFIEEIVKKNEGIRGIWCVPKYSNPTGITYSDETVKRLANLKTKANDFKIFWDLAYIVHDLTLEKTELASIFYESKKNNNLERIIYFCSTSKITFAGGGVAAFAAFGKTLTTLKKMYSSKTISFDKINQLRHTIFLKNIDNIKSHMDKHRMILRPKFDLVIDILFKNFKNNPIILWNNPKGGYFINVETFGSAKMVYKLCKNLGLTLTSAGATFPYGLDPNDSNLRIAPSFPQLNELKKATEVFCTCVKIAAIEKLISK